MAKSRSVLLLTVLATGVALVGRALVLAADDPHDEVLAKHGLKIVGSLAVLETESEVKNKLNELRRISKQLGYTVTQQKGTMTATEQKEAVQRLTQELAQMKTQLNQVNQQMARLPRRRGMLATTYAQAQYQELLMYQNQLQAEIYQETAWLNQLKSPQADPKAREKLDSEVRDQRDAYHQGLVDLRTLVDAANEKYAELAKDAEVKKRLTALGKSRRDTLKLGPSHDFTTNVKQLEKLEKAESSADGLESQAKPARRTRKASKGGNAASTTGSSDKE
jgi:hypothetical protein